MMWEVGKSDVDQAQAKHCNFDQTHCYKAFSVPVIFTVSSNTGYTTGGQILSVTGHGFNNQKITAQVDGVDCVVLTSSRAHFTCKVQPKAAISVDGDHKGQYGIRRKFVNEASGFSMGDIDTKTGVEKLSLQWETEHGVGDHIGNKMSGWFVAPATTKVRFYMTCDDTCSFDISKTADAAIDATVTDYKPLM